MLLLLLLLLLWLRVGVHTTNRRHVSGTPGWCGHGVAAIVVPLGHFPLQMGKHSVPAVS